VTVSFGASASLGNWRHLELEDVVQIDVSSAHAFQYHFQFLAQVRNPKAFVIAS
jgi:hypothetical protein